MEEKQTLTYSPTIKRRKVQLDLEKQRFDNEYDYTVKCLGCSKSGKTDAITIVCYKCVVTQI